MTKCEAILMFGGLLISIGTYFLGYCIGRIDEYNDTFEVNK